MRGALVIALCATGCFSDRGVALEVDVGTIGTTSVGSVKLFIGTEECDTCSPITVPDVPDTLNMLTEHVWYRDPPSQDMDMVTVKGPTVTFHLESDKPFTSPIVIAVGFDHVTQEGQPIGVATLSKLPIPVDSASIATTSLVSANRSPDDPLVRVWPQDTSQNPCVAVAHKPFASWDLVVPRDSPHCDGLIK